MNNTNDTKRACMDTRGYTFLMINTLISLPIFLSPSPTVAVSRQYAWLSVLVGTAQALMVGYVVIKLGLTYPDKTIIEYSQDIVGKFAGKIVGLIFLAVFLSISVMALREFTLPFQGFVSINIPLPTLLIMTMLLVTYAVIRGLKTISICSDVIIQFFIGFILILLILPTKNLNILNIKPIIPHDWGRVVRGSFDSAAFLAEDVIGLMLIPYVSNKDKLMKGNQLAVLLSGIALSAVTAMEIVTMSYERVDSTIFSTFMLLREAQFSSSLERIESIAIAMWGGLVFVKLSVYLYILADGLRQLLGLKDYKPIVYILAPIITYLAVLPRDISEILVFPNKVWVPIIYLAVLIILPVILLLISTIRKQGEKK